LISDWTEIGSDKVEDEEGHRVGQDEDKSKLEDVQ
jgi:hypothetical protein